MENSKKVPWADWEEWKSCWELLQTSPLQALSVLEIWSHTDCLPVRIECTRVLLTCLKECTKTGNPMELQFIKSEVHRLALSMAIVRCTNLIIDTFNDCKFARSVSQTAKSIDLPEFIVDLRHDATHSTLPSSFLIAKAVQYLLDWLFDNYWHKQAQHLTNKTEKILNDIDKFEKRAKTTTENYTLAKFAENLFNDNIVFKGKTGINVAELRWKMKDDSWALLFLSVKAKNPQFPASVLQGVLQLMRDKKISAEQAKMSVEEIVTLASPLKISYTNSVKNLVRVQNEDKLAFDIVKILLEQQVFESSIQDIVRKTHDAAIFSEQSGEVCEIVELPIKRWRNLQTWTQRPIGAYSFFSST